MTMKSSFLLFMCLGVCLINQSDSYGTKVGARSYSQSFSSSSASASASSYSSSSSFSSGSGDEIGKLPIIGPIPVANAVATASAGAAGASAIAGGSAGQFGGGSYSSGPGDGSGNVNIGTYSSSSKFHPSSSGGASEGSFGAVYYQNKDKTGQGSYIIGGTNGKQPTFISGTFGNDGSSSYHNQDKTNTITTITGNVSPTTSFGQFGDSGYYNKDQEDDGSYKKYPGDDGSYSPQSEGSYSNTGSSSSSINYNYKDKNDDGSYKPQAGVEGTYSSQTGGAIAGGSYNYQSQVNYQKPDTSFQDKYFQTTEEDKKVPNFGNQQVNIQGNIPKVPCCKPTFPGPNGSIYDIKVPQNVNTVTTGQVYTGSGFVTNGIPQTSPQPVPIEFNQNKSPKPCCKGPFPGPSGSIYDYKPAYAVGTGVKVPQPVQPPVVPVVPVRPVINFPGPQGSIHTSKPSLIHHGNQGNYGTQNFGEKIPSKPYKPELNFPGSPGSIHTSKPIVTNVNFQGNNQGAFSSSGVQQTQFQEKIPDKPFQHGTYKPVVNFPGAPGSIFSSKPVVQNVNTNYQSNAQSSSSSGTYETQFGSTNVNVPDVLPPVEQTIDFSGIYTSNPVSENSNNNVPGDVPSTTINQVQGEEVTTAPIIAPSSSIIPQSIPTVETAQTNAYQSNSQFTASTSGTYQAQSGSIGCTLPTCTPQNNLQPPISPESSTIIQPKIPSAGPTQPQIIETVNKELAVGDNQFGSGYNAQSSDNSTPAPSIPSISSTLYVPTTSIDYSGVQAVTGSYIAPSSPEITTVTVPALIPSTSTAIIENINQQNSYAGETQPSESSESSESESDRIHFIGNAGTGSSFAGSYASSNRYSGDKFGSYGGKVVVTGGVLEGPRGNPFQPFPQTHYDGKTSGGSIVASNLQPGTINIAPLAPTAQTNIILDSGTNKQITQGSSYGAHKVTSIHTLPTKITYVEEKLVPFPPIGYFGQKGESYNKVVGGGSNAFVISGAGSYGGSVGGAGSYGGSVGGAGSYGGSVGDVSNTHYGGYSGHVIPCKSGCKTGYRHYSNAVPITETKKYVFHIGTIPKADANTYVSTNGVNSVGGAVSSDGSYGFEAGGPSYVGTQIGSFGSGGKVDKSGGFLSSIFLDGTPSGSYASSGGVASGGSYSKGGAYASSSSFASASSGAYSSSHY